STRSSRNSAPLRLRLINSPPLACHVRFGSKADICTAPAHVRFTPNSDRESGFPQTVMCGAARDVRFGPKADISRVNAMSALPPRTFGSATQMSAKGQSDGSSAGKDAQIRSRDYVGK